ncbi:hypothetical protein [Streptomyces sp. NPDC058308]|uniref:hypothetical protein n=1 Tax=Streptomyces sp. NPDC058308 TaxID=3346440 RepID=UPI0036E30F6D
MKVRSPIACILGTGTAAAALAWLVVTGSQPDTPAPGSAVSAVAGEAPGYAIEDFNYPRADKILEEKKITLKRGDGHVVLAECASATDLIEVWTRKNDKVCFRTTGNSGYLTMEIPSVFAVKGNDYAAQVDMTAGADEKTFDIGKNAWTAVGESADEQGREHMLVEIRTNK